MSSGFPYILPKNEQSKNLLPFINDLNVNKLFNKKKIKRNTKKKSK